MDIEYKLDSKSKISQNTTYEALKRYAVRNGGAILSVKFSRHIVTTLTSAVTMVR